MTADRRRRSAPGGGGSARCGACSARRRWRRRGLRSSSAQKNLLQGLSSPWGVFLAKAACEIARDDAGETCVALALDCRDRAASYRMRYREMDGVRRRSPLGIPGKSASWKEIRKFNEAPKTFRLKADRSLFTLNFDGFYKNAAARPHRSEAKAAKTTMSVKGARFATSEIRKCSFHGQRSASLPVDRRRIGAGFAGDAWRSLGADRRSAPRACKHRDQHAELSGQVKRARPTCFGGGAA